MDKSLEEIDTVGARFDQVTATIDLMQFAVATKDSLRVVGFGVLEHACWAADELLKQGHDAFRRLDETRSTKQRGK